MPAVSVIIPTYKHRDFVVATLESVLAQTFTDFELIVVNDGSPDDTADVLRPLVEGGRIRYVEQSNGGQASARNRGLAMATGEFVAFLDDDDLWPPDKLEWQVATLREHGGVAVGGTARLLKDGVLQPLPESGQRTQLRLRTLFGANPFCSPGQVLIRAVALRQIGGFDPDIWGCDDLDLWMRLSYAGEFWHVDRVALHYRLHAANASRAWERMIVNSRKVFAKNIALLPAAERPSARAAGERWLYLYAGSERVQGMWAGRVGVAARAIAYFAGPAARHWHLAAHIVNDLIPRRIRRPFKPDRPA